MGCSCNRSNKFESIISKPKTLADNLNISHSTFISKTRGKLSTNYNIVKKIGSGAFAEVQLCVFKPLNTYRAVKTIHKAGLHSQNIDEDFMLQEISVLTGLDHPNILKCYEIFEDNWNFYISMEYCAGGELFDKIIKMKKFSEKQAAEIMYQLVSATSYCHEKHVIHRDLKPENILLLDNSENLDLKIADFGSSCFIDKHKKINGCFGSAYYVAPEVLKGTYDEKCDIWSLGVIMFVLLTGHPPYKGSNVRVIHEQVKSNPLYIDRSVYPFISVEAIDLLQKLLLVDPRQRISSKKAILHPWLQGYRDNNNTENLQSTLYELTLFNSSAKLKDATHLYLASQAIAHEEVSVLRKEFMELDKNGDGRISKNELLYSYSKVIGKDDANEYVNSVIRKLDINHNGTVDYTEFLASCLNVSKMCSMSNLEATFKMFDKDGSGSITTEEIKNVLSKGQIVDNSVWNEILNEADQNGDGVIDLKEFVEMMAKKN